MKVVVIIPSRYGSTRFEGKPLAPICGRPMIQWVYERCSSCPWVDDVLVATDDARIREAVEGFGGRTVMTAAGHRSGTDRVAEAAAGLPDDAVIVNVQGDQPLIHPESIKEVVTPFVEDDTVQMSTLAYKIVDLREITDPKDVKVTFDASFNALYFSRSPIPFGRDADTVFDTYKHLGVYAYTHRFLKIFSTLPAGRLEEIEKLEQLRALEYGYPVRVVISRHDSPEVDLPEDIPRIASVMGGR